MSQFRHFRCSRINISPYVIDAYRVARETGMGSRINTIMQTCFFAISGVLPRDEAIRHIKDAIEKTYSIKGRKIVETNFAAVDFFGLYWHLIDLVWIYLFPLLYLIR